MTDVAECVTAMRAPTNFTISWRWPASDHGAREVMSLELGAAVSQSVNGEHAAEFRGSFPKSSQAIETALLSTVHSSPHSLQCYHSLVRPLRASRSRNTRDPFDSIRG
jgi:hypothetical protein